MSSWETVALGELGEFRNGVNFDRGQEGQGLAVLKVKDFGDLVVCPLSGLDELDPSKIRVSGDLILQEQDLVFVRSNGNPELVGRSVLVGDVQRPTTFSGFCIRFRLTSRRAEAKFVAYALRAPELRKRMTRFGSGTGIHNLNQGSLSEMPLRLPPIDEQRAIASVLGALDDKVEQNRRTAKALEHLAQAIFRAWFVDFEPVKAKAAGATSFPSMPQEAFDSLPSRFVESEIGLVPEGWAVSSLVGIASFLNGLALQKFPPRGDGSDLRVIKIAELRKGSSLDADWANDEVPPQYIVQDGDLLFSWSGSLIAGFWFGGRGALNQHLFKVTSKDYPLWLCSLWIERHLPHFRAVASGKATTMGHINRSDLDSAKVVLPAPDLLFHADSVLGRIFGLQTALQLESRDLARLRDYLLPNLLSGKIGLAP